MNDRHTVLYNAIRSALNMYLDADDSKQTLMVVSNVSEMIILIRGSAVLYQKNQAPAELVHHLDNKNPNQIAIDIYKNVTHADLIRWFGLQNASSV